MIICLLRDETVIYFIMYKCVFSNSIYFKLTNKKYTTHSILNPSNERQNDFIQNNLKYWEISL